MVPKAGSREKSETKMKNVNRNIRIIFSQTALKETISKDNRMLGTNLLQS